MAYNRKRAEALQAPALVAMAMILFTATAEAQILLPLILGGTMIPLPPILPPILPIGSLLNLTGINVGGALCCTPTGNCLLGSPGVPGVGVGLSCTNLLGVSVPIGQGTTNVNGVFNISVPNLVQTLGNVLALNGTVLPCRVTIPLPINTAVCSVLNTTQGVLNGVPSIVTGLVQGLSGLLGNLLVGGLTLNATIGV